MGSSQNLAFPIRNRHLLISLLFLFFFHQHLLFSQGRQISDPNNVAGLKVNKEQEENKRVTIKRVLIGSSPPRCEGRCRNCGHCEAIQVPIVPQQGFPRYHFVQTSPTRSTTTTKQIAYSRGDAVSNYKPMSWKCKCGDTIFNP